LQISTAKAWFGCFVLTQMLTSLQNPLVKQIRKLQQAKYRRSLNQFLLEGTHLLQEACAVGWPLEVVCYTPQWQQKQPQMFFDQLSQCCLRLEVVSSEVLEAITTTVTPDGVVAIAQSQPCPHFALTHLGLALETIQDPGNLGTMIRTATAAGAEGLILSDDSVDPEHPKVLRASAGQWFRLPISVNTDLTTQLQTYQRQGIQIIATLPTADQNYWQVDLRPPTLFLMGNEGAGLSPALQAIADLHVKIPLCQGVESLNVAIAAALLLYECQRQRSS
jgi:RNA methyltransferase, TrmH family